MVIFHSYVSLPEGTSDWGENGGVTKQMNLELVSMDSFEGKT